MQRLVPAFCCASVIHLLIILVPYLDENPFAPQLPGITSIQINLASTSVADIPSADPNDEQKKVVQEPDPIQKEVMEENTEESILEIIPAVEPTIPAAREPQPDKNLQQKKTVPIVSPDNPTITEPVESAQNSETTPIAAAALITSKATPIYQKNPKPAYPALARKRNWQGSVTLSILVSGNGAVDEVTIHQSSGHRMLDNSALKSVKTWQFIPGMKDGQPIAMKVQVTIHFKLD
jgi:protein TonB